MHNLKTNFDKIFNITKSFFKDTIDADFNFYRYPSEFNLLTLHRGYNVDDPGKLVSILEKLEQLEEKILFPIHPRTNNILEKTLFKPKNIQFTEPLGYLDFIQLENNSKRIITDSGGIQKEAFILKKPCITLRSETEWVETVEEGWNLLLNPHEEELAEKIIDFTVPEKQNAVFGENVALIMV